MVPCRAALMKAGCGQFTQKAWLLWFKLTCCVVLSLAAEWYLGACGGGKSLAMKSTAKAYGSNTSTFLSRNSIGLREPRESAAPSRWPVLLVLVLVTG